MASKGVVRRLALLAACCHVNDCVDDLTAPVFVCMEKGGRKHSHEHREQRIGPLDEPMCLLCLFALSVLVPFLGRAVPNATVLGHVNTDSEPTRCRAPSRALAILNAGGLNAGPAVDSCQLLELEN